MHSTSIGPWRWIARGIATTGFVTLALAAQAETGSAPTQKDKPQVSAKKAQPQWVTAMSKHNGSGIRLRYSVPEALQSGQAASVQLQFSGVTSEGARVEIRAPEGATLSAEDGSAINSVALPVGQVTTLNLRVVPTGDGLQTLDVFTAQAERSNAQSVPLKVGSGSVKLKAMGKVQTMPAGEKVISLPATPSTK